MVIEPTRIDVAALVGTDVLLGRPLGEAHLPVLLSAVLRCPISAVVCLDFRGVQNITASWTAATIVPLLRMRTSGSLAQYLLLSNLASDLIDEVAYVLTHEGTPAILSNESSNLVVLGPLDPAYARTLDRVHREGKVTAKGLLSASSDEIGQTAWIKRLSTLNAIGLIRKQKVGREYTYEPLLEGTHG